MLTFFRTALPLLGVPARRRLFLAGVAMMVLAVMEAGALVLIAPLMSILTAPGLNPNSRFVNDLSSFFGHPAPLRLALFLGVATVGLYLMKSALAILTYRWSTGFCLQEEAQLVRRLMTSYLHAPYRDQISINSTERIRTLTHSIRSVFSQGFVAGLQGVGDSFSVFMVGVILLIADPLLALASGLYFGVVTYLYQRGTNRVIAERSAKLHRDQARDFQTVGQALRAIKEIQIRGVEDRYVDEVFGIRRDLVKMYRTMALVATTPRYVLELTMIGGAATIAGVAFSTESVHVATAVVGLFLLGGFRLLAPLNKIIFGNAQAKASMPSLLQLLADLHSTTAPSIAGQPLAETDTTATDGMEIVPRIVLDNVSFAYEPDKPVLRNISLRIEPGESIGLVGASGAGKSTLLDILLGILEPDSGTVEVGGRRLADIRRSWQNRIGFVPQSITLFDDTIRANVAFGLPLDDTDDAEIWRALDMSQLGDVVRALPDGIYTPVGEAGTRFSGGQRQRLGVARALFHRPQVLMFDEATSALDNETEFNLSEVMESIRGSVTTITIAHRLSTVRRCDRVLYLDNGKLVADGSFTELSLSVPGFSRMVELSSLDSHSPG